MQVIAIYIHRFARKPKIKEKSEKWIKEFVNKLIKRKKLVEKITRKGHYRDARIYEEYVAMSDEVFKTVERSLGLIHTAGNLYPFAEIGECVFVQIIYDEIKYYGHYIPAIIAQEYQIIEKCNAFYFVIKKEKDHVVLVKISPSELIKYLYHLHALRVREAKRVVRAIKRKIKLGKKETFPSSVFFIQWCLMRFKPFFFASDIEEFYMDVNPQKNDVIAVKMISDYGEIIFVLQVLKVQKDCFVARYISVGIAALLQN
jgi:hypothetical protein